MTVLEAIQKSAEFLGKKNVESPRLQAELLLAHVLKMPRMKLYLNFDRALSPKETDDLREMIKRRAAREPLQHIVGSTSFYGLEIAVNKNALVPRPETELLAELGWKFLNLIWEGRRVGDPNPTTNLETNLGAATRRPPQDELTALDFGTGTGCLAIALAAKCPNAKIVAMDVSPDALELAKQNAVANKVSEQIEFLQSDGFEMLNSNREGVGDPNFDSGTATRRPSQFDLIISNPPYIASAEIETLEPEVRDFDPRAALDGGADGLNFYRLLAREAKSLLKPSGKIMVEFGDGQADAIKKIFENEKWIVEAVQEDYSQRKRILIAKQ